ncbi:hypothetical protein, partial [Vibrio sp.]|uniref:hypothetical protein n=1 Tax=Vibrio sp. TaxID=678 RepID=UPI003D107A89
MASGYEGIRRAIHWEICHERLDIDYIKCKHRAGFRVMGLMGVFIVLGMRLCFAGGFYGTLTTTEGDTLKGARITAKTGSTVVNESYSDDAGGYQIRWSPNRIRPVLSGASLSIGNNVSYDGTLFAFVETPATCGYTIIDITGRDVTGRGRYAGGIYFLRVYDKTTGEIVGTGKFISFSPRIHVEFKAVPRSHTFRKASDNDSLIVEYPHDDMRVAPHREPVTLPEHLEEKHITLNRTRRQPDIDFTDKPDTLTIDTLYHLTTQSYNKDYDAHITSTTLENITGNPDTVNYTGNRLTFMAGKGQEYTLTFRITDTQQGDTLINKTLNIQSDYYSIYLHKLFHGLGQPREGLDVTLKEKTARTNAEGKAEFEFPFGELTSKVRVTYRRETPYSPWIVVPWTTDSLFITDNINGTLQEGTGPFAQMKFPINPQFISNGSTYTVITGYEPYLGPEIFESSSFLPDSQQVLDDPMMQQNPNYWNDYVWHNQLEREFYLLG